MKTTMAPTAELYLPGGLDAAGFLCLWLTGQKIEIELPPRLSRILVLLAEARLADADVPAAARGWRTRPWLVEEIEHLTGYAPDPKSVSAYATKLLQIVGSAFAKVAHSNIAVLERQRGLGMRLAPEIKLDVVDRQASRAQSAVAGVLGHVPVSSLEE